MDESCKDWEFASGLYKHGVLQDNLLSGLPNFSKIEVRNSLLRFRRTAERVRSEPAHNTKHNEPIDDWHNFVVKCERLNGTSQLTPNSLNRKPRKFNVNRLNGNTYANQLSKVFKYAAAFEEHYRGEDIDEPDYNEIYRYLGLVLQGEEPVQLKPGSAAKILEMLSKLKSVVMDENSSSSVYMNYMQDKKCAPKYLDPEFDRIANAKKLDEMQIPQLTEVYDKSSQKSCVCNSQSHSAESVPKVGAEQLKRAKAIVDFPGINPLGVPVPYLLQPNKSLSKSAPPKKRKYL